MRLRVRRTVGNLRAAVWFTSRVSLANVYQGLMDFTAWPSALVHYMYMRTNVFQSKYGTSSVLVQIILDRSRAPINLRR